MKKRTVIILIACVLLLILIAVFAYNLYNEWKGDQCYRIELYERKTDAFHEYFEIRHLNGGDISFCRFTVDKEGNSNGYFFSGADRVGDNTWVLDTSQSLPVGTTVYKFIITEEGLEFYTDEERTIYNYISSYDYATDESAFEGDVELYVGETQCLNVVYYEDGNILFELSEKGKSAFFSNTVEQTESNVWICGGTKSTDKNNGYYKLVKHTGDSAEVDYIDVYDADGNITRFLQIV